MLKIIKLATVVQALHKNFQKSLEIYEARMNYKVASIKIYYFDKNQDAPSRPSSSDNGGDGL